MSPDVLKANVNNILSWKQLSKLYMMSLIYEALIYPDQSPLGCTQGWFVDLFCSKYSDTVS